MDPGEFKIEITNFWQDPKAQEKLEEIFFLNEVGFGVRPSEEGRRRCLVLQGTVGMEGT